MKYLDEFRDPELGKGLLEEIRRTVTRPWMIMEICGGQTHAIMRHGIDQLLTDRITLVHGPGCPVCVTPLETIDRALAIAENSRIHLIVIDVVMPEMTGPELAGAIAEMKPQVRCLYVSGKPPEELVLEQCAGATARFLQKPFTADELGKAVRETLDAPG